MPPDYYGFSGIIAIRHQHGHRQWSRLPGIDVAFVGTKAMNITTELRCGRIMDLDMILSSSPDLNITLAPGVSADYSDEYGPHGSIGPGFFNSSCL